MLEDFDIKNVRHESQTCPAIGSQSATVCLPVKVVPFSSAGPAKVKCCGEPEIKPCCDFCRGKKDGTCEFTISQKIRVDIPVDFGATVQVGDTYVDCDCRKGDKHDDDCGCDD
ncbi:MAG TPA: hypothetical protein DEB10_06240 [Ruminococcaceae bacterium]|nr:hypothetical protein [Oscillospiraceae bacterium]